ncbi:MAG: hypothetical protein IAF94_23475 [Pirellulaceae bacterium]|nr:hypothetical protein [Pirellulaceae bacterium]
MSTSRSRLRPLALLVLLALFVHFEPTSYSQEMHQPLPLKRVVLFSSSVGFFEHAGEVEGNKQIEFGFKTQDINDLLKSMVVQDRDGGVVTAVNYGSPEPITRTLRTFTIDLTDSPTLAQIFEQLRGQEVKLETPNPVVGTVVGVERRLVSVGKDRMAEVDVLNVRTTEGLRSVKLDTISRTQFVSEKIDKEFQQALDLLATAHTSDQKRVKLDFKGAGKRKVSVGYIQEAPVWKTSYRLVLSDDQPPFLQGWAIVENTSTQDWKDVKLTLVSGRPISFVMDLYQPLFMARPLVTPELHASLTSRVYDQDLSAREQEFQAAGSGRRRRGHAGAFGGGGGMEGGMGGGGGGFFGGGGMGGMPPAKDNTDVHRVGDMVVALDKGVESIAQGGDVGELFRYAIKPPVTLPRNESAMLPIVNDPVKGEKVDIYNPAVHGKHPLAGLRLINTTALHLLQGPVTLFDGGEYAGDARFEDIAPGSTRLISYALDLETEVAVDTKPEERTITLLQISKGGLHAKNKITRKTQYTVKNSASHVKTVLLERTIDPAWKAVQPQPTEKTRSLARFAVTAEPGKTAVVVIAEEREATETILLTALDLAQVDFYIRLPVMKPAVQKALEAVMSAKGKLHDMASARTQLESHIAGLCQEQDRLRKNLQSIPSLKGSDIATEDNKKSASDLLQRYLKKLSDVETELEAKRIEHTKMLEWENKARQDLEKLLLVE